jgi:tRNA (guanine37-N1)-methyltransferase
MHIAVVTLFPGLIEAATAFGVVGRAIERGRVEIRVLNPRRFATDPHRTVDDRPYGGGPGMVMKVEPTRAAIRAAVAELPRGGRRIALAADGARFDHAKAAELAGLEGLVLLAGRYEGVDERLFDTEIDECLSIGDFVTSGGELPALTVIDAVVRLLPGVLGDAESAAQDSFAAGLLDWPHYTRPEKCAGLGVPEVLLSGDHAQIRRWRLKQALARTWLRRPDLVRRMALTEEQRTLLDEYLVECGRTEARGPDDATKLTGMEEP